MNPEYSKKFTFKEELEAMFGQETLQYMTDWTSQQKSTFPRSAEVDEKLWNFLEAELTKPGAQPTAEHVRQLFEQFKTDYETPWYGKLVKKKAA